METAAQRQKKYRMAHLGECRERERKFKQHQRDTAPSEWAREQSRLAVGRTYKHRYGLTLEQYDSKLASQNNLCGICGTPFDMKVFGLNPALDHNHKTEKLRDFCHRRCNLGIGHLLDSPELCRKAAEYLDRHACGTS